MERRVYDDLGTLIRAFGSLAPRHDLARTVRPERDGQRVRLRPGVHPARDEDVPPVQGRRVDLDDDLPRTRLGVRRVLVDEVLGPAKLVQSDGLQCRSLRSLGSQASGIRLRLLA